MPRTIVYSNTRGRPGDDYPTKLVKYVPAEVVSFFLVTTSLFSDREPILIVTLIACLAGTPLYLYLASLRVEPLNRPRLYSYVLALIAFAAWAVGTSTAVDDLFRIDKALGQFLLLLTVFLIPGIDTLLHNSLTRL
jgi:hypothetical protein